MDKSYKLIDSGGLEKLELWGEVTLVRPDPQAIWKKSLGQEEWYKADAVFDKKWQFKKDLPKSWQVEVGGLTFGIALSNFKHTGVFPEHEANWEWISSQILNSKSKILNLFGYTGGASLASAKAGAEVVHVDASKVSVDKARENAELSGLGDKPIRWIVDDADIFVKREISRGNKYDGIVLDPPAFGRGAKGEVWKLEENLVSLLENCNKILAPGGFILLNGYAEGYTPESYAQLLSTVFETPLDKIESGKLFIKENTERGFILHAGIFAKFINS